MNGMRSSSNARPANASSTRAAINSRFSAPSVASFCGSAALRCRKRNSFSLRAATAAGIGLLLTFIGLQNGGFVSANPAALVGVGPLDHRVVFVLAALIVRGWLSTRANPLAHLAGFALVAFPAEYGNTGIMTFVASHHGKVYQKDLGPRTAAIAKTMREFNPDRTWTEVR